mmetsp:Transcript_29589/g.27021  ORF Transcript_29589/g.27021 Transcript_29589/m.27021 type:complete len:477 (+) Transcript_29589:361-1791(+)
MMTTAGTNFGDGLSWLELHFSKHVLILFEFRANVLLALKDLITLAVVTLDTTNVLGVVDSDGAEQWDGVLALGQVMEIIKEVAVTTELSNGLIGLDKVSRDWVLEVGVLTMMVFLVIDDNILEFFFDFDKFLNLFRLVVVMMMLLGDGMALSIEVLKVFTKTNLEAVIVGAWGSTEIEGDTFLATSAELSTKVGLHTDSFDLAIGTTENLDDIFAFFEFEFLFLKVTLCLSDTTNLEFGAIGKLVIDFDAKAPVIVMIDLNLADSGITLRELLFDLGGWMLISDIKDVKETVNLINGTMMMVMAVRHRAGKSLKIVEMATDSDVKDVEVSAFFGVDVKVMTTVATNSKVSSLVGSETDVVKDVTTSAVNVDDKLIRVQSVDHPASGMLVILVADTSATAEHLLGTKADVIDLETEDLLPVVINNNSVDFVMAVGLLEKLFAGEDLSVAMDLSFFISSCLNNFHCVCEKVGVDVLGV